VAKVSLTGSVPTGRKVYAAAAAGLKHATMELGGKSPLIVFDDAAWRTRCLGRDQREFLLDRSDLFQRHAGLRADGIREAFLNRLTERTKSAVIGDPMDEATHIGPMVSERQRGLVLGFIEKGKAEGARLVSGGTPGPVPAGSSSPRSSPMSPTT
jgi:betaine-aldehyde dehydrogenase